MYLNCHSFYSLRFGTMPVETLVQEAAKAGHTTLALTDINSTQGHVPFTQVCKDFGIKSILGAEIRNQDELKYILLAKNEKGLLEINELISERNINKNTFPEKPVGIKDCFIIYPFKKNRKKSLDANEFIGVQLEELPGLFLYRSLIPDEKFIHCEALSFLSSDDYELHCNLRAIDHNVVLSKLKENWLAGKKEFLRPQHYFEEKLQEFKQIQLNTEQLANQCERIDFTPSLKNKKTFTGNREEDRKLLRKLSYEGARYRYGKENNKEALSRIDHELKIIEELRFSAYFLIAWDIINWSMQQGYYHVGRGSGANSIVAYCLKITDVDPIELDLYFERFLNPKRSSPPDFDIDYSWKDRDAVTQYIFDKYGSRKVALLGATVSFHRKSILRELGKVHGLPKEEIDRLIDYPADALNKNSITKKIIALGSKLEDFPNIRSIHAGGILISEEPITRFAALDFPPKGYPTTQWDMYIAEDIGYEKLDILSQRGIGHIRDAAEIVLKNKGIEIDVHQVEKFKLDPKVREQLHKGETLGCFYIESPAMRGLLKKLQCRDYLTLVAASSIIRPGVARSGMMREYIKRFHAPDSFDYIHPVMKEQLAETFGVMVYQEDVLKICHHFAGLDLADADVLRRAMSGKHRSKKEFKRIKNKFFSNCKASNYPDEISLEVWRQIESFAGYSFSKAHSASYAVESFQSLYLKTYFPREFMVAVINNFGGFYRTWVYFNEAKRAGANILLPCVNQGCYLTSIRENDIYIGFVHLKNLETRLAKKIENERIKNGLYTSIEDFISRTNAGLESLILLTRIGAFRFTEKSKAVLLWEIHMLVGKKEKPELAPKKLFQSAPTDFKLPKLEYSLTEDAFDEIELLEFPVSLSYFDLLETKFRGEIFASDMLKHVGQKKRMLGQLVTYKYVRTVKKEIMHFGTFVDTHGELFDSVHFPNSLKNYPFKGSGCYLLLGEITEEFGYPSITVEKMAKMPIVPDPRFA